MHTIGAKCKKKRKCATRDDEVSLRLAGDDASEVTTSAGSLLMLIEPRCSLAVEGEETGSSDSIEVEISCCKKKKTQRKTGMSAEEKAVENKGGRNKESNTPVRSHVVKQQATQQMLPTPFRLRTLRRQMSLRQPLGF